MPGTIEMGLMGVVKVEGGQNVRHASGRRGETALYSRQSLAERRSKAPSQMSSCVYMGYRVVSNGWDADDGAKPDKDRDAAESGQSEAQVRDGKAAWALVDVGWRSIAQVAVRGVGFFLGLC